MSVAQVLEAEKKLRVSSLFSMRSAKHGIISIRQVFDRYPDQTHDIGCSLSLQVDHVVHDFEDIVSESIDIAFSCDERCLVYIAGYVVFKWASKLSCH